MRAEGTNRSFHHTRTTHAPASAVWSGWMDVENWRAWDVGLSDAQAVGPLRFGNRGVITDRSGRKVPFEVVAFDEGRSYSIANPLPLGGRLLVERTIMRTEPTTFQHRVRFEGVGGALLAPLLGRQFRSMLPEAMDRLADAAERVPQGSAS